MFAHIAHFHTEVAGPLVYDKSTALEDGLNFLVFGVEVLESDEVLQKPVEIP